MEVKADSRKYYEIECDALVVGIFEGEAHGEGLLAELDKRIGGVLASLVENGEFAGKSSESAYIHNTGEMKARRLLLLGAGKREDFNANTVRKMAGTAARSLRGKKARSFAFLRRSDLPVGDSAQAATEGALWALFDADKYHTSDKTENHLESMILATNGDEVEAVKAGIERGRIIAEAANFGRDVINEPSNVMTPTALAQKAEDLAKEYGLDFDVLDEAKMKDLGMGSLLGVAQGSAEPAKMIVLRYTPKAESAETIAIVGKGVTFDTG
ncbi:MAG TPA: M17 family peptidase N-terminal domain-containing protein, partial [Blastocatellia bacterium]|nr:M17 family peptidase N-terminal domain-containing protein [Blastocatellia bacterium]